MGQICNVVISTSNTDRSFSCSGMHLFGGRGFASIGIKHAVELNDGTSFSFAFGLDHGVAEKHQVCFRVKAVRETVSAVPH